MKLCIIGPDKRTQSDLDILNKAKKIFDSVLYVPCGSLILRNNGILYKKIDLNKFDAVLPRMSKSRSVFAYSVLKNLRIYSPIPAEAYFLAFDRFLLLDYLSKNNIPTPRICMLNSPESITGISDEVNFPVSLRIPSKERGIIFANNKTKIKAMLDTLGTFNEPIYIEEFSGGSYIQAYVVGSDIFGLKRKPVEKTDPYFGGGKIGECKISEEIKSIAVHAARALNLHFCRVDISEKRVINISLAPSIKDVETVIKADLSSKLLQFMKQSVIKSKASVFERILMDIKSLGKF